jgi:hypothetical protein
MDTLLGWVECRFKTECLALLASAELANKLLHHCALLRLAMSRFLLNIEKRSLP